jgi:hypothetical protein
MSSDEQTIVAQHQTLGGEATADNQTSAGPEDQMVRFRRVALPLIQWKAGRRQARSAAAAIARILAGVALYCLPVIALCVALGALGYFMWVVIDVARSAGSLDFTHVGDAFGHFDDAARVFMASVGYILLALTLYLLAAVTERKHVLGFDVVELSPLVESHVSPVVAAKLVYKLIGMAFPER